MTARTGMVENRLWKNLEDQINRLAEDHEDDPTWKYGQSYEVDMKTGTVTVI